MLTSYINMSLNEHFFRTHIQVILFVKMIQLQTIINTKLTSKT